MASKSVDQRVEEEGMTIMHEPKGLLDGYDPRTKLVDEIGPDKQSGNICFIISARLSMDGRPELARR